MKQKIRKRGLRFKILFPAAILIVIICASLTLISCQLFQKKIISQGSEEARMLASLAASTLDVSQVERAISEGTDSNAYKAVVKNLKGIKRKTGITYLYTLYAEDNKLYYGVDCTDGDSHSDIGEAFDSSYNEYKNLFTKNQVVAEQNITKYNGLYLITAAAPLMDNSGNLVGALACDYNATSIHNAISSFFIEALIISAVLMVISLIILNLIISLFMKNIKKVNAKVYDLAHTDGDLTQKLNTHTGDELELMANNINALLEYIREVMVNITNGSANLKNSASTMLNNITNSNDSIATISATMQQIAAGCQETTSSIESINHIINETNDMVQEAYQNTQQTCQAAQPIMQTANEPHIRATESQEDARLRGQQMKEAVENQIERSKSVKKINELTENILNISSQTNLLSLNASIEAARAGEAGRGFAVVASEISTLAKDSADAASEIQQVSKEIIAVVEELNVEANHMLEFLNDAIADGYGKLLTTSENYEHDIQFMNEQ